MQALCVIWGALAAIGMLVAFFPCLGALNWLNIPFAVIGLVLSVIVHVSAPPQSRAGSMAGLILCGAACVLGGVRLLLGGGIL